MGVSTTFFLMSADIEFNVKRIQYPMCVYCTMIYPLKLKHVQYLNCREYGYTRSTVSFPQYLNRRSNCGKYHAVNFRGRPVHSFVKRIMINKIGLVSSRLINEMH